MVCILPAMHEQDCDSSIPVGKGGIEVRPRGGFVEYRLERAVGPYALVDLDHVLVQLVRQLDMPRENLGPGLIADPERIAEPARHRQRHPFALAFEQCIRRDGGAHFHAGDTVFAIARPQPLDRSDSRIVILFRIVGQQLFDV